MPNRTTTPTVARKKATATSRRKLLVAKIMRSAGRQVAAIDKRIAGDGAEPEKEARTLALIVRAIRELTAADAPKREAANRKTRAKDGKTEETAPRDIDELRRSLARKLEAVIAEGGDNLSREP